MQCQQSGIELPAMLITAIRQQIKNPERVSIHVDGNYSFSLSLDELLEQKIKNGDQLDESRITQLKKISQDGKLRARALEWILNRPRSVREFRDYLRRKKVEDELSANLVTQFLQKGYLNEERYAKWLVELRATSGKSNRAISAELASKGIERELISEVLDSDVSDESERIKQVIAKKSKLARYQNDRQKFMQYLARQGFSYDLIKSTLEADQQ